MPTKTIPPLEEIITIMMDGWMDGWIYEILAKGQALGPVTITIMRTRDKTFN